MTKLRVSISFSFETDKPRNVDSDFADLIQNAVPGASEVGVTSFEDEPFDDEEDIISDEEIAAMEENIDQSMPVRFPTFNLVRRIAMGYARLQRLKEMDAPDMVIRQCRATLYKTVAQLAQALPFEVEDRFYDPQRVLDHFVDELQAPHGTGEQDS